MRSFLPASILTLLTACATPPHDATIWRYGWVSVADAVANAATLPLATDDSSPLAIRFVVPEELGETDFEALHAAFRERGYVAPHSEPGMVGELTDQSVLLLLADPLEFARIDTRKVAERLWVADIPFGTSIGNSLSLILPRRAIARAQRCLEGLVPAADWQRGVAAMLPWE